MDIPLPQSIDVSVNPLINSAIALDINLPTRDDIYSYSDFESKRQKPKDSKFVDIVSSALDDGKYSKDPQEFKPKDDNCLPLWVNMDLAREVVPKEDYPLIPGNVDFIGMIQERDFLLMLGLWLLASLFTLANMWSNSIIIDAEVKLGIGIPLWGFVIAYIFISVIGACTVYLPYKIDKANGHNIVLLAILLYLLSGILWAVGVFHSLLQQGTGGFFAILYFCATIWLGWVCYHFNPYTFLGFMILAIWSYYLLFYTYSAGLLPWAPTGRGFTDLINDM